MRRAICLAGALLALCLLVIQVYGGGDLPAKVKKEFNRLIASENPDERAQAVRLLTDAGDMKAFKLLLRLLKDEKEEVVLDAAFDVMKGFKDRTVIDAICRATKRCKVINQRAGYIKVLWEFESEKAYETVLKFWRDSEWEVRMAVADCLGEAKRKKGTPKAKRAIDTLIPWLFREQDGRTQNHIRAALYYLTGKDFALDKAAWEKWWEHAKDEYGEEVRKETEPADRDGDGKPDVKTEVIRPVWREPVVTADPTRPKPKFFGHEISNARVAFVIDSSGSMGEAAGAGKAKLDVVRDELIKTIKSFDKRYWFNIFYYSDFCGAWKKKLVRATKPTRDAAMRWLQGLRPLRMTNIAYALRKAADDADTDTMILLSDGLPTAGIVDTTKLLKYVRSWNKHKKIKISTVGMRGADPNFLTKLAQQNGGSYRSAQ